MLGEMRSREFEWAYGILYNQGEFDRKSKMKMKAVHWRSVPPAHVYPPPLTLPIRTFWVPKRKRKEADYIFIHQHCCFSLLYNTQICERKIIFQIIHKIMTIWVIFLLISWTISRDMTKVQFSYTTTDSIVVVGVLTRWALHNEFEFKCL